MKYVSKVTTEDEKLCRVVEAIEAGNLSGVSLQCAVSTMRDDLAVYVELVLRGDRMLVPSPMRGGVVQLAHFRQQGGTEVGVLLRSKVWFPGMDRFAEQVVEECKP